MMSEVEDVFVAVIEESVGVHRFVMANVDLDATAVAFMIDVDGFDPMDHVLENEVRAHTLDHLKGAPWVCRPSSHVQEKGSISMEGKFDFLGPILDPCQVIRPGYAVIVSFVRNAQVIRRGRYHNRDGARGQTPVHTDQTILLVKLRTRTSVFDGSSLQFHPIRSLSIKPTLPEDGAPVVWSLLYDVDQDSGETLRVRG
jgi:hypothetical protein